MLFSDYHNTIHNGKHLPDYYDTMYLDGFSPYEILLAHRRSMMKQLNAVQPSNEIKISSEIKVK